MLSRNAHQKLYLNSVNNNSKRMQFDKKDCLKTVITALKNWENNKVVEEAIIEIIDVHKPYKNFAYLSQQQAIDYIKINLVS